LQKQKAIKNDSTYLDINHIHGLYTKDPHSNLIKKVKEKFLKNFLIWFDSIVFRVLKKDTHSNLILYFSAIY